MTILITATIQRFKRQPQKVMSTQPLEVYKQSQEYPHLPLHSEQMLGQVHT